MAQAVVTEVAWMALSGRPRHAGQPASGRRPRLLVASVGLAALSWAGWAAAGRHGLASPLGTSALLVANAASARVCPGLRLGVIRIWQRYVLNPAVRILLAVGVLPLGISLLETTGRHSGRPRRTPVGEGRQGRTFWIVAEHGRQASYVRNIAADPYVRVKVRRGLRTQWRGGLAQVMIDDDPYERQRQLCRRHPLRALNAAMVRVMGTDLVTIRIDLGEGQTAR